MYTWILTCCPCHSLSSTNPGTPHYLLLDACAYSGSLTPEQQKINSEEGGLTYQIQEDDSFGEAVARLGDLDGNGAVDFAVGNGYMKEETGSVFIIFLNPDNTVLKETRIGNSDDGESTVGGLASLLPEYAYFGTAVGCLGDLDRDRVPDLIVGADGDDEEGGALYVLFLLATGEVKNQQRISATEGGLGAFVTLDDNVGYFGTDLGVIGELDESGTVSVVVGTGSDELYHVRINGDGTVGNAKSLYLAGGREGAGGVADIGDVDGNGFVDIAVGAPDADRGRGGVYVLLMGEGDTVLGEQLIASQSGGLGELSKWFYFGYHIDGVGDLDGDGIPDIAASIPDAEPWNDAEWGAGAVYILLLTETGSVKDFNIISPDTGLIGPVVAGDNFGGGGIATLVEREDSEQGVVKLVVGAWNDGSSAVSGGALYVLTCKIVRRGGGATLLFSLPVVECITNLQCIVLMALTWVLVLVGVLVVVWVK